jgi:hypothetical protein
MVLSAFSPATALPSGENAAVRNISDFPLS